jgi:hypothetical protein
MLMTDAFKNFSEKINHLNNNLTYNMESQNKPIV